MGAFDNYTSPSSGAFANYQSPASEPGAPDWLPGAVWLNHMSRVLQDATTFGLADKLGDLPGTGTNVAAERAKTDAARTAVGPIASTAADIAGYSVGAGELGGAAKIGEAAAPYLGKWAGGVLGSGAEGALAGGTGALGHGGSTSDAGNAALLGGALGAGAGTLGGVVGRGGTLPTAPTADALSDAAKQAYAPLTNVLYDATKEVHPAIDPIDAQNALRDWSGYKWNDATKTKGEINTLLNKPQLSANDLQQSQSYLKGIAGDGRSDPNDALYAAHYAKKLQDVLDNATPQTGVPQNWTNPTGAPSFAAATKAAGDALYSKAQDVGRLDDWIAKSKVPQGPDVGSQASSYLRTGAGQTFAPPGSPGYDALSTLAKTSAAPDVAAAPSAWDLRHMAHPLVGAALGGALNVGTEHDFDPAHIAEAALGGAALGYGLHKGVPAVQGAFQRATQQRAIDAARVALATGQQQSPLGAVAPFRNAVRNLIFGQGAAGSY
jgi:hypothetical protein